MREVAHLPPSTPSQAAHKRRLVVGPAGAGPVTAFLSTRRERALHSRLPTKTTKPPLTVSMGSSQTAWQCEFLSRAYTRSSSCSTFSRSMSNVAVLCRTGNSRKPRVATKEFTNAAGWLAPWAQPRPVQIATAVHRPPKAQKYLGVTDHEAELRHVSDWASTERYNTAWMAQVPLRNTRYVYRGALVAELLRCDVVVDGHCPAEALVLLAEDVRRGCVRLQTKWQHAMAHEKSVKRSETHEAR